MRRTPQQQRSRGTVDVIVEAATRVLARLGWAKFTTNEVARVAGVSVGSLYQYFPSKLALAEAIRQRHLDNVLAALPDPASSEGAVSLERRVAALVDGVIATHSINPKLHRVLLDEVPLAARSTYKVFEAEYLRRYLALIEAISPRQRASDDGLSAHVLAGAVEGVVHAAARYGTLDSAELKVELNHLLCAYLRGRLRRRC
ncbi:TetR/AcrR family transcriptional regulator [Dyella sp. ASV21]|uniref:TetR/AcrR family transcriptional regulator n=1 Tax=Dyella sp. ASV21 TaxID=2795114 RepID=UPI001E4E5B83|nr:TetR/AcrR family transcriptional regulator [Dyella sp. ASV21]